MELSHKTSNLKISKGIGILTKLRRYLSKNVLRTLFYALVQPHRLWAPSLGKCNTHQPKTYLKKSAKSSKKNPFQGLQPTN